MTTGAGNAVQQLVVTVQDAMASAAGGGGTEMPADAGKKNEKDTYGKEVKKELNNMGKNMKKSLGATLGIKFGTASLLKQSQVFTGFVGSIFQLFGAMVDVILAPFLPVLIPGIRKLAETIPYIRQYAQNIFDFLDRTLFEWIRNGIGLLPDNIKDKLVPALAALITGAFFLKILGLWGPFRVLSKLFVGKPLWALATKGIPKILGFGVKMLAKLPGIGALTKMVAGGVGKVVTKLGGLVGEAGKTIGTAIKNQIGKVLGFGKTQLARGWNLIRGLPGRMLTKITTWGRGLISGGIAAADNLIIKGANFLVTSVKAIFKPLIAGAQAFFKMKGVAGKLLGGALSKLPMLAKGAVTAAKSIPVLGAVAEVGYGGYKAYQDYKKYGLKEAGQRLALTAATATGAFFDPTGVASAGASIVGNIAMDRAYRNNAVSEAWAMRNRDLVIEVKGQDGQTQYYEKKFATQEMIIEAQTGMALDKVSTP